MRRLAYLTGTWPNWSETFIAREVAALIVAPEVGLVPLAIWRGETATDDGFIFLTPRGKSAAPQATAPLAMLPTVPAGLRRRWSLTRHRQALGCLVQTLHEQEARHLHAAFADLPGLLAAEAAEQVGIGYSVSVHAADVACAKYADAAIFGKAQAILACNAHAAQVLAARYPAAADRVHVIHHGVQLSAWPWRTLLPPAAPLRLLCVARLVPKKRMDRALAVLAALRAHGLGATLEVIGDGPARAWLERLGSGLPVHWRGWQAEHVVRAAMENAHLLLLTSEEQADGDFEGIPNVIVEAMAVGLPVAAMISGGIAEVLDARTGWPLAPDPAAAAATIVQALRDPAAMAVRAAAARQRIAADFDAEPCFDRKLALWRAHLA